MKYATERPLADPGQAERRLLEHAHALETIQDGRIDIEKINGPFLFESGTYVKFTGAGAVVG